MTPVLLLSPEGPYLAPGACEPLDAALTGPVVAHLGVGWPLVATPLQRQTAELIGQAEDSTCPHAHPTLGGALHDG